MPFFQILVQILKKSGLKDIDSVNDVNVRAPISITQLALPYLKKTKGNIINMASVLGSTFVLGQMGYNLSKAANIAFTSNLALELAPFGIRVNAVSPGTILTEGLKDTFGESVKIFAQKSLPLGRIGQPEYIARAVTFLASDFASFITGANIPVDGGSLLVNPLVFVSSPDPFAYQTQNLTTQQ